MRQLKVSVVVLVITSCMITILMQLWHRYTHVKSHHNLIKFKTPSIRKLVVELPISHVNLNDIYQDISKASDYNEFYDFRKVHYMLNTPGCKIPLMTINYAEEMRNAGDKNRNICGKRAVFIDKLADNKIRVVIKKQYMKKYLRKSAHFECCYQFLKTTSIDPENKAARYTQCLKLKDGSVIELQADFIKVKCYEFDKLNKSHAIYDDVYAFVQRINITNSNSNNCKDRYNILMINMDSMSLPRTQQTMPRTFKFFQDNFWLIYRAFHKVDDDTLQNMIPSFTGMSFDFIRKHCAKRIDGCSDLFIWNKFKKIGYMTAFGEDNSNKMADIFSGDYSFRRPPVDHFMKPFFKKCENCIGNKCLKCSGKVSSAKQLLNYALDFVNTYRNQNFFGFFRINSYKQNKNCGPWNVDQLVENFLNQLSYTGVLADTFIIFFSEHGIKFGANRIKAESFYDERLSMLSMWMPYRYIGKHQYSFKAATYNQYRFVTPYDIFNTLEEVRRVSTCDPILTSATNTSLGCPQCHSLFEGIDLNRTCQDVGIHEKWCSCHGLYHLPAVDTEGTKSVLFVVNKIQKRTLSIKTRRCWSCKHLSLQNVFRIHFYYDEDKVSLYYVVAFSMKPGNVSYEATVILKNNIRELVGPISVITPYNGISDCTFSLRDHSFCVCNKTCT